MFTFLKVDFKAHFTLHVRCGVEPTDFVSGDSYIPIRRIVLHVKLVGGSNHLPPLTMSFSGGALRGHYIGEE